MQQRSWRLPDGVDELLPPAASELERLRRAVLDLFRASGYEHIEPPLVEYLDSLLVGSGADLDLQTLKVVDQRSGRMLGLRADMTSQAVRVDSHSRPVDGVQRLCYAGTVLFANPRGALTSRLPFKAGAELFGSARLGADVEIVDLMLRALEVCGVDRPVLLLGNMAVYRALTAQLELSQERERDLFEAVQRKARSDIKAALGPAHSNHALVDLPEFMGGFEVLGEASSYLAPHSTVAAEAVAQMGAVAQRVIDMHEGVVVRFDLAELAGYGYHNGLVFSAFQAEQGAALAQGGRYDNVGEHFGRARPATGFDLNLKALLSLAEPAQEEVVWSPWTTNQRNELEAQVELCRASGKVVICALDEEDAPDARCTHEFVNENGTWEIMRRVSGGS